MESREIKLEEHSLGDIISGPGELDLLLSFIGRSDTLEFKVKKISAEPKNQNVVTFHADITCLRRHSYNPSPKWEIEGFIIIQENGLRDLSFRMTYDIFKRKGKAVFEKGLRN